MTLIELMIAMLISMVLIGGVIQLFIGSRQSYQTGQAIGDLQETARFAALLLENDIRMAGYLGCNSRGPKVFNPSEPVSATALLVNTTYDPTSGSMNTLYVLEGGLQGWEAQNTGDGEYAVITNEATQDMASSNAWATSAVSNDGVDSASMIENTLSLPRSDAIRVWRVAGEPAVVDAISASSIRLTTNPGIEAGEMLMLTDCASVDIVRACRVSGGSGAVTVATDGCTGVSNNRAPVTRVGAFAFALVGKSYFVGRRVADDAQSTVTLYQREWRDPTSARAQPVLENIESLQFLYGEDTDTQEPDGIANRYVTAANVTNWHQVVSVRAEILTQSERTDLPGGAQTLTFNGTRLTGSDGRLRYAFVTTIALRNRVP